MTRRGWLLFLGMSLFWGIPYFFIKIAVAEIDPSVVAFVRVAIAALILVPIAFSRRRFQTLKGRWGILVLLCAVQIVIPFLAISYGEQHIASSLTSLLIASEPIVVALLALRLDKGERVSGLRLVGLGVGLIGVVVLLGLDVSGDEQRLLGAALILLAVICYAIGALLIRRPAIASAPSLDVIAGECLLALTVLTPLALLHWPTRVPSLGVLASLLVLGLISTALAWLVFFALIAEVGASRGIVFTYVNPAVSVLLGVTLLGEPLGLGTIAGFLLILAGSWFSTGGRLLLPTKRLPERGRSSPKVS